MTEIRSPSKAIWFGEDDQWGGLSNWPGLYYNPRHRNTASVVRLDGSAVGLPYNAAQQSHKAIRYAPHHGRNHIWRPESLEIWSLYLSPGFE